MNTRLPRSVSAAAAPAAAAPMPAAPTARPLSLHIDHLVLDGVALNAAQGQQMQRALQRELGRLLDKPDAAWQGGAVAAVTAPALRLGSTQPAELGRALARSLYAALQGRR